MIKKEELRVGNYVQSENGFYFRVEQIFNGEYFDVGYRKSLRYADFNSIPLTPEILTEWCGFETKNNADNVTSAFFKKDVNGDIDLALDFDWRRRSIFWPMMEYNNEYIAFGSNIIYLHELQNLYFALTGEELEIKIPSQITVKLKPVDEWLKDTEFLDYGSSK